MNGCIVHSVNALKRFSTIMSSQASQNFEVARGGVVLVERRARTVGVPGRVELDAAEGERGLRARRLRLLEGSSVQQLLAQRERAVDEPARVAAGNRDPRSLRRDGKGFGTQLLDSKLRVIVRSARVTRSAACNRGRRALP